MNNEKRIDIIEESLIKLDNIFKKKRVPKIIRVISNFFTDLEQGIKNIFIWLPVIWKDRQFDRAYLYIILGKKLKLMEKFFLSDDVCSVDAYKHGKNIKIARILCDRLIEGDYLSNAMLFNKNIKDEHFKFEFEPIPDLKGFSRLLDNRTKSEKDAFTKACALSELLEKQDKEYLFDLLKKNITYWWD